MLKKLISFISFLQFNYNKYILIANNNDLITENVFINDLDKLLPLFTSYRCSVVNFLMKNFREIFRYIIQKNVNIGTGGRGGKNKIFYMITNETLELVKNSYNLKHRYVRNIGDSQHLNVIMSLENQTIGFIENSFKNVIDVERQKTFKNGVNEYRVDLYFPSSHSIVECDENSHKDRDIIYEKKREEYILSRGNIIVRFNPNDKLFELSLVLREINKILFSKVRKNSSVVIVDFNV